MKQARTISLAMMVTRLPCLVHKLVLLKTSTIVFRSLLEGQDSCALHSQVTLSGHVMYNLSNKTLEGSFPDEEICIFLELLDLP